MSETRFADGFDRPDPILLGLAAGPLLAVVGGLAIAYLVTRLPLPGWLTLPLAGCVAAASGAGGWLRLEGRPLVEWVAIAGRFALRPRSVVVSVVEVRQRDRPPTPAATAASAPLVTVTTPVATQRAPGVHPVGAPRAPGVPEVVTPARPGAPMAGPPVTASPRRIALFSLAGGTGRTTLAVELACLLAARGRDAALIDADATAPAVALRLGIAQPTLWAFATSRSPTTLAEDRMVRHATGVRVLPGPPRPLTTAAQMAERGVLDETIGALAAGGAELIVIDLGRDLGPLATWGLRAADDIVVVLTPTPGGILDAYRVTAALRRLGHRAKLSYVLNRAAGGEDGDLLAEPLSDLGGELAAVIPDDPLVRAAEARHRPFSSEPGPAAAAIIRLAGVLSARAAGPG